MRRWTLTLFGREVLVLELHEDPVTLVIEDDDEEEEEPPPETLVWPET